ncbi:proline and serine-rich protein 3 isoform X2 [Cheilinus undulatus]|uniref:proline and serine-rich protein 3 isoform X2 n=1 Tax=Cheilinus undulatus TaxID=241271 RepID=UPI001BD23716|nr:proline and serine-rich protein 3 isoform X2 [Cheilinus undulatus]
MKSSRPVFTRQNPFQQATKVGKTFYHPSSNKSLTQKKKKTTLSPERSHKQSTPQLDSLSQDEQGLIQTHVHSFAATDDHPVFEESWPSSDCGSSSALSNMVTSELSARAGKPSVSPEPGIHQDSVLAKYIERFRHGQPQSREERQQMAARGKKQVPFWWMSSSTLPHSSTPTKTTDKDVIQPMEDDHGAATYSPVQNGHDRDLSPCRGSISILSDTSQGEFEDTEILQLQERANRLLLKDDCSLNDGSIHVSSEGVGCSEFSSPLSADEQMRRPLIPRVMMSATEDILFQWRLRRKIEQAREQHSGFHATTFSWQSPSLRQTSPSGQAYKGRTQPPEFSEKASHPQIAAAQPETRETLGLFSSSSVPTLLPACAVSGSAVSQPLVPAHMHFLCDVLPCPIQSTDESRTKVVHKKAQVQDNTLKTARDEPFLEHEPSVTKPSSGVTEEERSSNNKRAETNTKLKCQITESRKNEKEAVMAFRRQKKSTRYAMEKRHTDGSGSTNKSALHQKLPKKPLAKELKQHKGYQEFSSQSATVDHGPPPSPVHSALGQVVSEVLFPTTDSPAQTTSASFSPPSVSSPRPQSSVNPCDRQNSVEVISQLLQEAEDSDETEFGDDALLKVLRKQRKWIKEQISEVDSLLNNFLDEQQVTRPLARDT